ncbi:MAG: hypothetical protein J5919_04010 [Clostridia bacterium]|nr:hypothetical protein [Clostridia bacterium]
MKKIIAFALSVLLLVGMMMTEVGAYAVDLVYELDSKTKKPTDTVDYKSTLEQYLTLEFATAEEKLESMEMLLEKDGYQLWADRLTGEVATKDLASGQILFSNPYDVGAKYPSKQGPSDSTKKKLMSQLMIRYVDNDTEKEMYSFDEAAMNGQIKIKNIKNGIRVEYSIGREETRMLVPKVIEKSRFESQILEPFANEINEISRESGLIELNWRDYFAVSARGKSVNDSGNSLWFNFNQLLAYYQYKATEACATEPERISLIAAYPICRKMNVYVFDTSATTTETMRVENYIKTYCPSYTYEMLEADHALTEYEGSDKNPALFKVALEYTLDEWGMSFRCPVNGLRFDESLYQLVYISVLPYMGAGANYLLGDKTENFTGYNFFPDGSGTLFRHENLATNNTTTINAKVYGADFAYNNISGTHSETVRYPVFGIVSNYHDIRQSVEQQLVAEEIRDPNTGEVISPAEYEEVEVDYTYSEDRGFVAIIEEGDALAELSTYHAGSLSKYNSISMLFYPRPKDSYNLANAISVGANASWTVVCSRKYVGNYKVRYIMLTDQAIAEEKGLENTYEPTWMGMATAYRDYLTYKGELQRLEAKDVSDDIPVYIETFGAIETVEKVLSIPVNTMAALSSFENVKTMYDELSAEGVNNIKFKLTGYANGGMYASIPYKLKWEKVVGGADGYRDLVSYAKEKGFQVFPDFDFAYVRSSTNKAFDGLTFKKHIVKSINNTYMSKRYYSATRQTMLGRFDLCVSPAYYSHFYEKLNTNLLKYYGEGVDKTISIASLGTALNSDFDEDEPYNREDSKKQTIDAVDQISSKFDYVMTEGANAYVWKYVDYILNVPLDSSRYTRSSNSVPFIGVVLHGSKQFAGTPLNMDGNIGYSLLKAIENGSGVYFILAYQNFNKLKEDFILSEYYSVRYDILKNDVVKYYTLINDLTKDLQLDLITSHEFLSGERVPDPDEVLADAAEAARLLEEEAKAAEEAAEKARVQSLLNGRVNAAENSATYLSQVAGFCSQAAANDEGGYTVAVNGNVTVTVGMKTLVDQVISTSEVRSAAQAVSDEKYNADKLKAAILEAWTEINDPFKVHMTTGSNGAYATILAAYEKAETTYNNNLNTTETRKAALDAAVEKAISDGIAKIPDLLAAYNENKTEENLEALKLYAGSVADAEKYVDLTSKITESTGKLSALKDAYKDDPAYVALLSAKAEKNQALKDAEAADKAIINELKSIQSNPNGHTAEEVARAQAYADATVALTEAKADLTGRLNTLKLVDTSAKKALATLPAGSDEYVKIEQLIADTEKETEELNDPDNTTNPYKAAVAEAQAAIDAFTPATGAARTESEKADRAVEEYVENYTETYTDSSAYKSEEAKKQSYENELEALTAKFTAIAPVNEVLAAFAAACTARNDADATRKTLENSYSSNAEYTKLLDASDTAEYNFTVVSESLLAAIEEDPDYIALKKKVEDTKAALEVYTLAYLEEPAYLELKEDTDEIKAEVEAFENAYLEDEEYKTLAAAFEAAEAELESVKAEAAAAASGEKLSVSDSLIDKIGKAVSKYAEAKAAIDKYNENFEADLKANKEYNAALVELEAAQKLEDAFIKDFNQGLEDAAAASKSEEKPEETEGGKYAIARDEYETAVKYLNYFDGTTSVPSTVKDAVVYSTKVKNSDSYKKADSERTAAKNALATFTADYGTKLKATNDTTIATITDPVLKEYNVQYRAANEAYTAATTEVSTAAAALRGYDKTSGPTVYNAANSYYTAEANLNTAKIAADKEKVHTELSSLRGGYDSDVAAYAKISDKLAEVKAESDTAHEEYTLAASDLNKATKAANEAVKAVRDQINRITGTIVPRLNYYVGEMLKTVDDSNLAVEVLGGSSEYSDELKNDVKEANKIVIETEKEVRVLSDQTIASAKHALETASRIIEINAKINDPYNPTPDEPGEGEGEDDEEDKDTTTKYTDNSGNIVAVGYSSGVTFLINYNYFDVVTVYNETEYTLPAYGGFRLNTDGTATEFSTFFVLGGLEG